MDLNDVEGASVHPQPGSGQANKMDWEPRTARPPEPHFMTHQYRPFRMPTTVRITILITIVITDHVERKVPKYE